MLVEQFYLNNPLANFNYLVACAQTGEALAIDPLDAGVVLEVARRKGWSIRQVVNTHEHWDHHGGNQQVCAATGAIVLAHKAAVATIGHVDVALGHDDTIKVGKTVELQVLDTPGHTFAHVCLRARGDSDALFCGDTLFNAGAGNCSGGGDASVLYETYRDHLDKLPDQTRIYPGHSYAHKNLQFALDREPNNGRAASLLKEVEALSARGEHLQSTMGLERQINVFLRLESESVGRALAERFPGQDLSDPRARFVALRRIRDTF